MAHLKNYPKAKLGAVNPLSFWEEQQRRSNDLDGLTRLALDVFSCPTGGVDCERMFSRSKRHVSDLRHSLSASSVSYLTSLQNWFAQDMVDKRFIDKIWK